MRKQKRVRAMITGNDQTEGRRIYDWWSRHPRALDFLYDVAFLGRENVFRRRAIETLDLRPGERLLEVGCGNGNSFPALRDGVGSHGVLVGLDVSRGMVRSADDRIRDEGWQNVHVVRGDVRKPPVDAATFDAAYASMSLSAVPDTERAIQAIETALRPGGRLVILDAQPFQRWPSRLANPIIIPIAERATNWMPEVDLLAILRREFNTLDVDTFNSGSIVIARAQKSETT